jgi:shikimate dehydrogenase
MPRLFGLIGFPLSHSFSKQFFTEKFEKEHMEDAVYELFPIENFPTLITSHPFLKGLNVTIPHKSAVIPFLDQLDKTASAVGAVNCIAFDNGRRIGYNTDVIGFEQSLKRQYVFQQHKKALILGAGGAAKAVQWVLQKNGMEVVMVSRSSGEQGQIKYQEISNLNAHDFDLVVQATPVGTWPNVHEMPPIPVDWLLPDHLVFDLVYNPSETLLLRRAAERGCRTQNGLEMLYLQAEAAWKIWNEMPGIIL